MSRKQGEPGPNFKHNIEAGDNFYELAKAYYKGDGSTANIQKIQDANKKVNPNTLQPGDKINIPA